MAGGGKTGKKMRKGEARASATTALDAARRRYLSIFPSQGEQRAEVKAFSGWTKCSLLAPDWIWQELKTAKAAQLIMGWFRASGRPAAVTNWLNEQSNEKINTF